jgi:hypothetical protein
MRHCLLSAIVLALLLIVAIRASSQTQNTTTQLNSETSPKVTAVSGRLEVGKEIVFTVTHLSEWAQRHDPQKLVPLINGRLLKRLYPEQVDLSQNQIRFHLHRTPETSKVWNDLFQEPLLTRSVSVSVGLEDQPAFDSAFDYEHEVPLTIIPPTWGLVSLLVVVLTLGVFFYLARTTNLIRDPTATIEPSTARPYSLGRAQMAFWFLLIFVCYVSLWLVTGNYDTIGHSQFVLVVISSLTAVGSRMVSIGPTESMDDAPRRSKGFFIDLLSDSNGVRLHRFQLCAWTLLLGLIFAAIVYDDLVMPNFGDTLLTLIGINAAAHVGFTYLEQERSTSFLDRQNR